MIGTTKRVAICAALLALGGMTVACGDDDDGGTPDAGRMDAGRDAGGDEDAGEEEDAGSEEDAGPPDAGPPPPNVRLAHLVPGAPAVHVCINAVGVPTSRLITVNTSTGAPSPVPYSGISPYTDALTLPPIPHVVRVFPATAIEGGACPASDAGTPLITQEIDIGDLTGGAYYTVAAIGLAAGTGATAPRLLVSEDDLTAPAAGTAHIRLFHAIPNLPGPVNVCYDADGEGAGEPEAVFTEVAFGDVEDYLPIDPTPVGATFSVHLAMTGVPACADATRALGPIAVPLPVPPVSPNLQSSFDDGEIITAFAIGDAATGAAPINQPASGSCTMTSECAEANPGPLQPIALCNPVVMRCVNALAPNVWPWQDNLDL